jgi:phospholipid/cholesterol/gamma-HCH transport system substrate-binding protein
MKVQNVGLKLTAIGAFVAVCLLIFVTLLGMTGVTLSDGHTLTARFPIGLNVVANSDVRARGVKVGRVKSITNHGPETQVTMSLDDKALPVYRDARVHLRFKTLVGETYVDLDPGTREAGELESGALLPVSHAREAVRLDDILSTFGPKTRERIQSNLRSLAGGFEERGEDVNTILASLEPVFGDGGRVMAVLDEERERVAAVVDQAGDVMQAFGERSEDVRTLAVSLRQAATAASERDEEIGATLRELPGTLAQSRASTARLGRFSQRATPVVRDLTTASRDLAPAVRDLEPAARDARKIVDELKGLLPRSESMLVALKGFGEASKPVAPALDAVLRQANPALAYLAPYHREFGAFFANIGSVIDTQDALGKIGRVHPVVSETSLAVWTPEMRDALNALIDAGGAEKLHREYSNPYPAPGTVGKPEQYDGSYTLIQPNPPSR